MNNKMMSPYPIEFPPVMETVMKYVRILVIVSLFAFTPFSPVRAELLTDLYGVDINDNAQHDTKLLFQLFNDYFAEQLTVSGEGLYGSSNDLFNARGLDPNSAWITNGTEIVGAFKIAGYEHNLVISDRNSDFSETVFTAPSSSSGSSNRLEIVDLSGLTISQLADGMELDLQLEAKVPYLDYNDYSWSSDPALNDGMQGVGVPGDGMIHMIALDITDLYNAKYGTDNESVYLFGFEDMHFTTASGAYNATADGDYQDFVVIMTNLSSVPTNTPEPATWMIVLLGGTGTSILAWRKRKMRNK